MEYSCQRDAVSEDTLYEDTLLGIKWKLRQLRLFLHQFDEAVDEAVVENGVGTKRMDKMVNGGSKPMRRKTLEALKQNSKFVKQALKE
jgi:hypothetical protein